MSSYLSLVSGGIRWRLLPDHRLLFEFGAFSDIAKLLGRATLVRDGTRSALYEVGIADLLFFVKVYKPGEGWNRLWTRWTHTRAHRELEVCLAAVRRGVQVVPLTAVGERGSEGFVVTQLLDGWTTLQELLLFDDVRGRDRHQLLFQLGVWVRQVHDSGVLQPALDLGHILVKTWGDAIEFRLMDYEKMCLFRSIPESKRLASIARLNEFPKLTRTDRVRFMDGYVHKYPEESRSFREMLKKASRAVDQQSVRKTVRITYECVQEGPEFGLFTTDRYQGFYRRATGSSTGLELEEVVRIAEGHTSTDRYRRADSAHVIFEWKKANMLARDGAETPLAVFIEQGRESGYLLYLRS